MTTKEALHQLVDRLPEDQTRTQGAQTLLELLATLPQPQLVQLVATARHLQETGGAVSGGQAAAESFDSDTAWTRLSKSSFSRDWESEADSIYDDEPLR